MTELSAASAERRLLVLTAGRWLPVGVTIGLPALLALERGVPLGAVGLIGAAQGVLVLLLELPTGGLADALGRRPVQLAAAVVGVLATALYALAPDIGGFVLASALLGVFRALDSGPLEAWYVDTAHAADRTHRVERGLARAGTVLGAAIAVGALVGGGLVAADPLPVGSALLLPYLVAIALMLVNLVLVALLMREPPRDAAGSSPGRAALTAARRAPRTVADGVRLLGRSRVLLALVLVEVFWSTGMTGFESLMPVRLAEQLGDPEAAGAWIGPASAAAWGLFALGSWLAGVASRPLGVAVTAIVSRVANAAAIVVMGMVAGPIGLVAGFWAAYLTHGAQGPMHSALLHRQADASTRATVLSINSMVAGAAYSVAAIALFALADAVGAGVALVVAGALSAVGALLYVPALRAEGDETPPRHAS